MDNLTKLEKRVLSLGNAKAINLLIWVCDRLVEPFYAITSDKCPITHGLQFLKLYLENKCTYDQLRRAHDDSFQDREHYYNLSQHGMKNAYLAIDVLNCTINCKIYPRDFREQCIFALRRAIQFFPEIEASINNYLCANL